MLTLVWQTKDIYKMLLIYTPKLFPRITYSIKTLLKTFLRFSDFEFTTSLEAYLQHEGPKFSYSNKTNESGIHFHSVGLLEQKGISELSISVGNDQGIVTLFHHGNEHAVVPYDPFAASFYMLSRYEEYLPHIKDHYNRFSAKNSIAAKNNFLQTAVVDRWAAHVKSILKGAYPGLSFPERSFNFLPTIDVDNAYAFKHKGVLRTLGALLRSIYQFDFQLLKMQLLVLLRKRKDPYDTYYYQLNLQKKYRLKTIYFFLLGDYGKHDKNISHENKHFQSLIKNLADHSKVGIHPSFKTNYRPEQLATEINRLSRIVKRNIVSSRQHYIKLNLPETYRNLVKEDIEEDYTMGYADAIGFRAGSCTPYFFYDLDEEMEVKLKIFPFQLMEASLKHYLNYSPETAIREIKKIIKEVVAVKGTLISVWHNESLGEELGWEGWREVYEALIETASNHQK